MMPLESYAQQKMHINKRPTCEERLQSRVSQHPSLRKTKITPNQTNQKKKLALHQVNLGRKVPRTRIKRDVGTVATRIAIQSGNVQLRDRNVRSVREKAIFPACLLRERRKSSRVGSIQLKRPGASVATEATMKEEHVQLVIIGPGVGGKRVISNPDTGAEIDCIPEAMFLEEFASVKLAMGVPTIQASEAIIENVGCFEAEITWKPTNAESRSVQIVCHVLRGLRQPALSRQTQFRLGILHPGYSHVAVQELSISNRSDPAASGAAQESPAVLFPNLLAQPERVVAALTTSELTNQQREEDLRNIMNEVDPKTGRRPSEHHERGRSTVSFRSERRS